MNVCDSLTAASCCDTDWLMCLLCNHLSQYYVDQLNDCYNLREGWTHIIVTSCALLSSSFVACTTREGCVAPNADISLQSGRFWATVIASSSERLLDLRSCWIVFIHVVRGRPGGLFQFSKGEAVMMFLASVSSGIHAMSGQLTVPRTRTNYGDRSFAVHGPVVWNSLPADLRLAEHFNASVQETTENVPVLG